MCSFIKLPHVTKKQILQNYTLPISLCECIALKFFLQRSLLVGSISDILNFEMSDLIQSLQVFLGLPRPKHPLTTKFVISFIALVLQHAQTSGDAGCFQVIYTKSVQDEK